MLGLGAWGTAGVFAAMVCALLVFTLAVAGLVLLVRPVFHGGGSASAHSAAGTAKETSGDVSVDGENGVPEREKGG